jgi:hypothetical protein
MDAITRQCSCERLGDVLLAYDIRQATGSICAIERCGHPVTIDRTPDEVTPRAPARACLPLLPSGPGGFSRVTPREGSRKVYGSTCPPRS